MTGMQIIRHAPAERWSAEVFHAAGMPADEAAMAAKVLVRTSLRGIDTHGISRLPSYIDMLGAGHANPRPAHGGDLRGGTLFYTGDRGLGQVIGTAAMRQAIEIARDVPTVPCIVSQCGHLAALGMFTLMAAEAGMFAFVCQSTPPYMGLPGWKGKAIGNNPLAFSIPVKDGVPLVFDMAASVVARGNVSQALREKTPIPLGWALGPDGEPTTDAAAAMAGTILPVGGYKGMGLAMLVQSLVGSMLGNSPELLAGTVDTISDMGAFIMVINPALASGGAFEADTAYWLDTYRTGAGDAARYPGERAAAAERDRRISGIPVPPVLFEQLKTAGERLGVPFTLGG
jgi:LDH2 family malate/lactate/ureidoglycolate dehydrogenase